MCMVCGQRAYVSLKALTKSQVMIGRFSFSLYVGSSTAKRAESQFTDALRSGLTRILALNGQNKDRRWISGGEKSNGNQNSTAEDMTLCPGATDSVSPSFYTENGA
jgi:hypothetical protein